MRRDRLTFGMMVGVPLIQLTLFGLAINSDPKQLPTAVLLADQGPQGRSLLYGIRNSGYFEFVRQVQTEDEAQEALARGEVGKVTVDLGRGFDHARAPPLPFEPEGACSSSASIQA